MGMFEEAAKKKADAAAASTREQQQREAEQSQSARKVAEDLKSYLGQHPILHDSFDISVQGNFVVARRKATPKQIEIRAEDKNTFRVTSDTASPFLGDKDTMTGFVVDWLNKT